jgi:hypothetical protein
MVKKNSYTNKRTNSFKKSYSKRSEQRTAEKTGKDPLKEFTITNNPHARNFSQQRTTSWCFSHLMLKAKILICLRARLLHDFIALNSPMLVPWKRPATTNSIKSLWGCFPHCPSSAAAKVKAMNHREQDTWIRHVIWFWNPVLCMEALRLHRYHRLRSRHHQFERE